MATRQMGAIYLIMTVNSFSILNFPFSPTSSEIDLAPTTYPTKIQVKKATMGIKMELLRKSKKSRMVMLPRKVTPLQMLKPRQEGRPMTSAPIPTSRQAFSRVSFSLSQRMETMVSIREIPEVNAAKNTKIKKMQPMMLLSQGMPPLIRSNTWGRVWNISPGPAFISEALPPEKT